jgi:transcriptional regulator with PAS, ATPase and Fis domain
MIKSLHLLTPSKVVAGKYESITSVKRIVFTHSASSQELIGALGGKSIGVLLIDHTGCESDLIPLLKTISRQYFEAVVYLINVSMHEPLDLTLRRSVTGTFEQGTRPSQIIDEIEKQTDLLEILREEGIYGHSSALVRAAEIIFQVAQTDVTVLIGGESGTGKEMFAKAIHSLSPRSEESFVAVNCGAIAEGVLESELFGHEKGAFTGAASLRQGYFEVADGGTIFLDEIGEIKPEVQVRLLRVLEQRSFMRVGGTSQISTDVRIIAASNRDLKLLTDEGTFREDLYYRLSVVTLNAVPLRERPVDIMPLIRRFFDDRGRDDVVVDPNAVELLLRYSWPGNIRELRNFVESSLVTSTTGTISAATVSDYIAGQTRSNRQLPVTTGRTRQEADFQLIYQALMNLAQEIAGLKNLMLNQAEGLVFPDGLEHTTLSPEMEVGSGAGIKSVEQMERELIAKALREVDGNRRKAAQLLGIGERTLYRKIKQYDMQ